jgi:hypothetical protein
MRFWAGLFGALTLVSLGHAQLLPEEKKAISDALFLNNLSLNDLNFFRRPVTEAFPLDVAHAYLDKPVDAADSLMALHKAAETAVPSSLIRLARSEVFGETEAVKSGTAAASYTAPAIPSDIPDNIKPFVADYAAAVSLANESVYRALRGLSASDKRLLVDSLPGLAVEDPTVSFGFLKTKPAPSEMVLALLQKVDLKGIRKAAELLASTVEKELPALQQAALATQWTGHVKFTLGHLHVVVSGVGDDEEPDMDAQLVIDLGGVNHFTGRAGAGIMGASLLINFGAGSSFDEKDLGPGCGLLGIGLAYDMGGRSRHKALSLSYGSGVAGVGVFYGGGGDDDFSAASLSEGFGEFGIGALIESAEGKFSATAWAQGAGRTQGVGWLVNQKGTSLMKLGAIGAGSFGQGYSGGYGSDQGSMAGGFGLVTLGEGDAIAIGQTNCQASAANYGVGSVYQAAGSHDFIANEQAQGYSNAQSAAFLYSMNGDGSFVLKSGQGQGFSVGDSVSLMLDRSGSNVYSSDSGPAQGVDRGLALFVHDIGKDRFESGAGTGVNTGGGDSIALFVNLDSKSLGDVAACATVRDGMGLSLEQEGGPHAVHDAAAQRVLPKPGSQAMPDEASLEKLYNAAVSPALKSEERIPSEDAWIAIGTPGFEWLLANRLAAASPAGLRMIGRLAQAIGDSAKSEIALKAADPNDRIALNALRICVDSGFKEVGPLVVGLLSRPALQREAIYAAGIFTVKDATSTLIVFAGQKDREIQLAAMNALTSIADPSCLPTARAMLGSDDMLLREAAIRIVAALPSGIEVAQGLLKDPDERVARQGVQILARIGTPAALDLVGSQLTNVKSGVRIQALLALSGRVPDKYKAAVDGLKHDPSPLVQAVVNGLNR